MAHFQTADKTSLLDNTKHRFAHLWYILRTDGVSFAFTDHDSTVTLNGVNYRPGASMSSSAREAEVGLAPRNLEVIGALSSDRITHDDLRAGRYREAEVTEYVVDWMYPWVGFFVKNVYWITETTFNSEGWSAQLGGIGVFLQPKIGDIYSETCRHVLGDSQCQVDFTGLIVTATVTTVDTSSPRRIFCTDDMSDRADATYNDGKVTWTSGLNSGLISEINYNYSSCGQVYLYQNLPFDINVGDTAQILPGCNKTIEDCKGLSGLGGRLWANNIFRFGGFPYIPGPDRHIQAPRARN